MMGRQTAVQRIGKLEPGVCIMPRQVSGKRGVKMYSSNRYLTKGAVDGRIDDSLKAAQTRRVLRQAGIEQRHSPSRAIRLWLFRLGCTLVGLGRRLQRLDASLQSHHQVRHSQSA